MNVPAETSSVLFSVQILYILCGDLSQCNILTAVLHQISSTTWHKWCPVHSPPGSLWHSVVRHSPVFIDCSESLQDLDRPISCF